MLMETVTAGGTSLFVGDLASFCDEHHIEAIFHEHGFELVDVKLMRGKQSMSSLSYGFVQLKSNEDALRAISELDGKLVYGRKLKVRWAVPNLKSKKNTESVNSVYVKFQALTFDIFVTEEKLRNIFLSFGAVTDVSIKTSNMNRISGERDSGYGFVHFLDGDEGVASAFKAIATISVNSVIDNVEYVCEASQNLLKQVQLLQKNRNLSSTYHNGGNDCYHSKYSNTSPLSNYTRDTMSPSGSVPPSRAMSHDYTYSLPRQTDHPSYMYENSNFPPQHVTNNNNTMMNNNAHYNMNRGGGGLGGSQQVHNTTMRRSNGFNMSQDGLSTTTLSDRSSPYSSLASPNYHSQNTGNSGSGGGNGGSIFDSYATSIVSNNSSRSSNMNYCDTNIPPNHNKDATFIYEGISDNINHIHMNTTTSSIQPSLNKFSSISELMRSMDIHEMNKRGGGDLSPTTSNTATINTFGNLVIPNNTHYSNPMDSNNMNNNNNNTIFNHMIDHTTANKLTGDSNNVNTTTMRMNNMMNHNTSTNTTNATTTNMMSSILSQPSLSRSTSLSNEDPNPRMTSHMLNDPSNRMMHPSMIRPVVNPIQPRGGKDATKTTMGIHPLLHVHTNMNSYPLSYPSHMDNMNRTPSALSPTTPSGTTNTATNTMTNKNLMSSDMNMNNAYMNQTLLGMNKSPNSMNSTSNMEQLQQQIQALHTLYCQQQTTALHMQNGAMNNTHNNIINGSTTTTANMNTNNNTYALYDNMMSNKQTTGLTSALESLNFAPIHGQYYGNHHSTESMIMMNGYHDSYENSVFDDQFMEKSFDFLNFNETTTCTSTTTPSNSCMLMTPIPLPDN